MNRLAHILVLVAVLAGLIPAGSALSVQTDPGIAAHAIREAMFEAQLSLSTGDTAAATTLLDSVQDDVDELAGKFTADPASGQLLTTAFADATDAVVRNDELAFASARGTVWTAMVTGAFAETIAALESGDAATANMWLLLRDFRTTTRYVRPGTNATDAVAQFASGSISSEQAIEAVRADLLDTYQSLLEKALADASTAFEQGFGSRAAEEVAIAAGYWRVLAPAYATQVDSGAVQIAEGAFARLVESGSTGSSALPEDIATVLGISQSFRAAPLTTDEQKRRAGQFALYLELIPVEYRRGVKNGQVLLDIEIQEAQAFLEGARSSFDDLRLILQEKDPELTAEIDSRMSNLDQLLKDAASHTSVADPDVVEFEADWIASSVKHLFPEDWTRAGGDADFDVIDSVLDTLIVAARNGQWDQAESARLEAYAIYEMGAEKRLLAFAPDLATRTEQLFWQGTGDIGGLQTAIQEQVPIGELREIRAALDTALDESRLRLGAGRPATAVVVFNAATIVFREGLEAVLILASLVASMIGANTRFKRPLVLGAMLALVATAVLFVLARTVLQSLSRYGEKVEAVVGVIAIGVLLLVMNWFFHKVYWTKWIGKHHARRRAIVGGAAGQALGLVILGFTSVFREGAETVLFLQALVLDAGTLVVIEGTLLGLLGVAIVGALVLVMQHKLPHKKMLMVTGVLIAVVLVIMVGNTMHALQVVGWAPITAIPGLVVPYWMGVWFGVFSTWEGLIAQGIAVLAVFGSYFVSEFISSRDMKRAIAELNTA